MPLIRDAKSVGFTISEIGQLMDVWYNDKITVAEKLAVLDHKLNSINARIKQLQEMKKSISQFKKNVVSNNC